jgi:hypothetical protein
MQNNPGTDPAVLGCTILSLRMALEETLKALAEMNGNQVGEWLDEVQELALLRAKALTDTKTATPQRLRSLLLKSFSSVCALIIAGV